MKLKGLKLKCLLAGRPGVHHGPRQKVPFGSGGESQLQTLACGAAHAALPKEGAAHLLPSGREQYRNSMVPRNCWALRGSLTGHWGIAIKVATRTQ